MLNYIKKYFKTVPSGISESFADDIIRYLYNTLKIQKNHLSEIKIYYNNETISCIVRLKFDDRYVKGMTNDYYYFLINCFQSEVNTYGQDFQDTLSDDHKKIIWIHENKILKFYPEQTIMNILSEKLDSDF